MSVFPYILLLVLTLSGNSFEKEKCISFNSSILANVIYFSFTPFFSESVAIYQLENSEYFEYVDI